MLGSLIGFSILIRYPAGAICNAYQIEALDMLERPANTSNRSKR